MLSFDHFTNHLRKKDRSENTINSYLKDLSSFANWFKYSNGEELRPENITPIDAREYRQWLLANHGLSPATFNRHLAAIRSYINWAVQAGIATSNPLLEIRSVKMNMQPKVRWLDRKEQLAILRKTEECVQNARTLSTSHRAIRNRSMMVLILNTGLRLEEMMKLKLEDVDISQRRGTLFIRSGKGLRSRVVPLNADARRSLEALLEVRPRGERKEVFLISNGKAIGRRTIQDAFKKISDFSHVEFSPHTLRHTFAKNLIDSGVGIEKVAMLLGHSSIETTRIYTTPSSQDLVKAVEGLI